MDKLVKRELYSFKNGQLSLFSNGDVERFFYNGKIKERKLMALKCRKTYPPIDLSTKPSVKHNDILLDFSNLENFHHMFIHYTEEFHVTVYDKNNKILLESYMVNRSDDILIYNYDYTKKILFIYSKLHPENNYQIAFAAVKKDLKHFSLVTDKYPVSINDQILTLSSFGCLILDETKTFGTTKIYLPKDEIERRIFDNHYIQYHIQRIVDETIIGMNYYDKNED